jgi:hypothetical protein
MLANNHFMPFNNAGVELGLEGSEFCRDVRIVAGLMVSSQNWASPMVLSALASCVFNASEAMLVVMVPGTLPWTASQTDNEDDMID